MDHFEAVLTLGLGAISAIDAVESFARRRSILWMALFLSVGAALIALALLALTTSIHAAWLNISKNALWGIAFVLMSILGLYSRLSPKFPRWTQWAMLVFGVGCIFVALIDVYFFFRS
jgi:hypothetical protein